MVNAEMAVLSDVGKKACGRRLGNSFGLFSARRGNDHGSEEMKECLGPQSQRSGDSHQRTPGRSAEQFGSGTASLADGGGSSEMLL